MAAEPSIQETLQYLDAFPLEDQQPNIEAPSIPISYESHYSTGFADRGAYETRWTEELATMAKLEELLAEGRHHVSMVYTYRSCSKALPQVKTSDDPNRTDIYEKTFQVMEPEIDKLKRFMSYQQMAVKSFCELVRKITEKKNAVVSEGLIMYMIKILDLFHLLDALKNMKACLNNDLSFFKRAYSFLKRGLAASEADQTEQNHSLYLFLANPFSLTTNLKNELQNIPDFDDVLALIVNQCAAYLETNKWVLPEEKHCLLRVMPYGLFLMDSDPKSPARINIFKSNKKVKLDRFFRLFKKTPIVPLYGDMQLSLEVQIKRCPNFDDKSWGGAVQSVTEAKEPNDEYTIGSEQVAQMRNAYTTFLAKFRHMVMEIRKQLGHSGDPTVSGTATATAAGGAGKLTYEQNKQVTGVVLEAFGLLSDWTGRVLQQAAWKFAHPNQEKQDEAVLEYERVVRYNYNEDERNALVEVLSFIKGLAGELQQQDALLSPILRTTVHDELQEFIQIGLREMIQVASKKKKSSRADLLVLRFIAADWATGIEPDDPALFGKAPQKESERIRIPSRAVGPSATQLVLIRSMVYGFFCHKYLGEKKGVYAPKDFKSSAIKLLEEFYDRSFYYPYLLDYAGTVTAASDLGSLWYREFYLELSHRLQFPIEMSLPWILTDHILEHKSTSQLAYVLYPLALYDDAANRALRELRVRFLYDEIEAEVNLCFDQLVFKLAEQVFTYFKHQASAVMLDKAYRRSLETHAQYQQVHTGKFYPPKSLYDVLIKQRHITLLGRTIDLNHLLAERMNSKIRENLQYAITRYEASDVTHLVELEHHLANIRLTYDLMVRAGLDLDPWTALYAEANQSISLVSFHGRIVLHTIFELIDDFFPNFNFNSLSQRFVRTDLSFTDEIPRIKMPKSKALFLYGSAALSTSYANAFELTKQFFGMPHMLSLVRVIGVANLPLVISECLQSLDLKLNNVLSPYVRELMSGMPSNSKLPIHDYGTMGIYGKFLALLKDLIAYPDLRPEVFQHFREFGNTIVFLNLLDHALTLDQSLAFAVPAPFLAIGPDYFDKAARDARLSNAAGDMSTKSTLYTTVQKVVAALEAGLSTPTGPVPAVSSEALRDSLTNAWRADKLYRPPDHNSSVFRSALTRLNQLLDSVRADWSGAPPDNGVVNVESTTEFYRLWSALLYVFCFPTRENEMSNLELFGEGLLWSGAAIIHFLGQRRRFEVFDFAYHLLNVEEAAPPAKKATAADEEVQHFMRNAQWTKDANTLIFQILDAYWPVPETSLLILHPPTSDFANQFIETKPEDFATAMTASGSFGASSFSAPSPASRPPAGSLPPPPQFPGSAAPPPPPMDFMPPPPPPREDDLPPPPPSYDLPPPPPRDY